MNSMADVFHTRLFETVSLTAAINEEPYVPGVIGQMGLFEEEGVTDTSVFVERQGSSVTLIPTKDWGEDGTAVEGDKRDAIPFTVPHIPARASIVPSEIQGVRQFGTTDQMATLESVRTAKIKKMAASLDATLEYHRLGALQGKVLDADGTTVVTDIFKKFEVTKRADVSFDFTSTYDPNDPAKAGAIRILLTQIRQNMTDDLNMGVLSVVNMGCLCGDTFWNLLTNAPEVRQTYLAQASNSDIRLVDTLEVFRYGNCDFINYRGSGKVAIGDDNAQFFAKGIPGLFLTRFAPAAEYFDTVNTIGLPKYTKAALDPSGMGKFISLESSSNPLNICTRPRTLRGGKIKS